MSRKSAQNPPPDHGAQHNTAHSIDAIAFARDRLGFYPDPDQARVLDPSIHRGILLCCRQWGKSTTVAVLAVWEAFHNPGSLIVIASPSGRQSSEFVRKAAGFLRLLDIRPRGDGDNEISLVLPNGSRIVGLPGEEGTIRGFSNVRLLLVDEASRVPDKNYQALRPMIAANPRAGVWLLSTPNGRQGFFYEEWVRPDSNWTRIEIPATRCPRISPEFLEEERRHHPDQHFRQEYLCEFVAADFSYFDPESVKDAFRRGAANHGCSRLLGGPEPILDNSIKTTEKLGSRFYLGLDLGQAHDYSAIAIAERRTELTGEIDRLTYLRQTTTRILVTHLERIPLRTSYPDVVAQVRHQTQRYQDRRLEIVMDATGVGAPVKDMLMQARLGVTVYGVTITGGERVTISYGGYHVPRHDLLANLRVLLEKRMLEIDVPGDIASALRAEFLRWGHRSQHDDLIFAIALACWKAGGQPIQHITGPLPMYPNAK